jgi:hypothetical protein
VRRDEVENKDVLRQLADDFCGWTPHAEFPSPLLYVRPVAQTRRRPRRGQLRICQHWAVLSDREIERLAQLKVI